MWVRLLSWETVVDILGTIESHICDRDQNSKEEHRIGAALNRALWNSLTISGYDFGGAVDWGELEVTLQGRAPFYFNRRNSKAFQELRTVAAS